MFLGALVVFVLSDKQLEELLATRPLDGRAAVRVDVINCVGLALALLCYQHSRPVIVPRAARLASRYSSVIFSGGPNEILLLFAIGAISQTVVLILTMSSGAAVAGVLRSMGSFAYAALLGVPLYNGRYSRTLRLAAIPASLLLALLGLLSGSKTTFSLPLLSLGLGYVIRWRSFRGAVGLALTMSAALFVIAQPIAYFRTSSQGSLMSKERGDALSATFRERREDSIDSSPLARLCYLHSQWRAVAFYDEGRGGNAIRLLPYLFVPRFVYPEKPIMTQDGPEFFYKITGQTGSSEGRGVFIDGYYNSGWAGVIIASMVSGFVLAQLGALTRIVLGQGSLIFMPFVFSGVYQALRSDGDVLNDYAGAFVTQMSLFAVIVMALKLVGGATVTAVHRTGRSHSVG
jgi:hypothetical protein